jgi:putative DNA methylase
MSLEPFSWKDRPALMESLFPVQKISAESFKEQMSNQGKTLTSLGSYWKGRKPLILNKACVLGCLLPATSNPLKDLEIFELLMAMDNESLAKRLRVKNDKKSRFFLSDTGDISLDVNASYRDWVYHASRPEECNDDELFAHIWADVNAHLETSASNFPELVQQMGIARFGRRPRVADVFSGSGQIPFEAARLGCDAFASDINPVACMLTWGAFNIVGASPKRRAKIETEQRLLVNRVKNIIDKLGVETDGKGWMGKAYLYCIETRCPESGWLVPLLPSLIISKGYGVIAKLVPDAKNKRYNIDVYYTNDEEQITAALVGTVSGGEMFHSPDGVNTYRSKISTIRGDYRDEKISKNRLRLWEKSEFMPREDDIFQERLYCIQWMKKKPKGNSFDYEFRPISADDILREKKVVEYVNTHFHEWQKSGYVPDMIIEQGDKTDEPIRTRGWTHWHQLFNPRQLLVNGLYNQLSTSAEAKVPVAQALNWNAKLCRWLNAPGLNAVNNVFDNQALNTLYNYGTRSSLYLANQIIQKHKNFCLPAAVNTSVECAPASEVSVVNDIYITDPPYGDAVKYEEITEFFIAWLRKNPPKEFADWTWDSRRALAIKGEDEAFRQSMIRAYRRTREMMPDNGIQVLMFTHQSGSIWADMASIIWASGLQVTASWYVVTETDSALRQGANVTGTIMLVLRKRLGQATSFRDDLGWEIEAAVKQQIEALTGLDLKVRDKGSEGLYTDADLQMAGYAAALKVLTAYSHIDGKDMVIESEAPKQSGKKSFVEDLIDFAVQTAVQFLVPLGFEKSEWQKLSAIERFYLKMAEMEAMGEKSLDNYQNFAKAFKVKQFSEVMSDDSKANHARLKLSTELKAAHMSGDGELSNTPLRALLYALFELSKDAEVEDVLNHLAQTYPQYLRDKKLLAKIADYLADKRASLKPTKTFTPDEEASHARVLAEAIRNQKL